MAERETWFSRKAALWRSSINLRAKFYVGLFLALFAAQTALVATHLLSVDHTIARFENTWLPGAGLLSRVCDQLAGFRLAEAELAMPTSEAMRGEAAAELREHRGAIGTMLDQYALIANRYDRADIEALRRSINAYFDAHDLMFDGAAMAHPPPHDAEALLDERYEEVESAIARLVAANRNGASTEATHADRLVKRTIVAAVAIGLGALLFGIMLLRHVQHALLGPLLRITGSLVRLASNDDEPMMPGSNRSDEIGAMAKAFDAFRERALELKAAHEATRVAQEQAQVLARHDPLTGLPNRRLLAAGLRAAILDAQRYAPGYLVLVIDLDRFKPINDLYGHPAGDIVLCSVANRLRRAVREHDMVARLGGDEFAVVARAMTKDHAEAARELAMRILATIRAPIVIGSARVEVDASIGIAYCPRDGTTAEGLLRAADIAMYRAKHEGKGTYRFFEQTMDDELRAQASLEADLKHALANGDIQPFYQPLVRLDDGSIAGFEVLARWRHAQRGWVSPDTFVPLVEQMGVAASFTASLLRRACRDAVRWPSHCSIALNISPVQFRDPQLAAQLLPILAEEGLPPGQLEIEITESTLMSDLDVARSLLTEFRRAGVRVSLDDFGTGYSSLQLLRELKFDKVKIDRSFVLSMLERDESEKIVDAIVALAASLGMVTVAEGVETCQLNRALKQKGCHFGQGFFFGRPMPARDVDALLDAQRGEAGGNAKAGTTAGAAAIHPRQLPA